MLKQIKKTLINLLNTPPFSGLSNIVYGRAVPIFMLHRIHTEDDAHSGTSVKHLQRCLQYLTDNNFTFLSLEDLLIALLNKGQLPEKFIVFTIDDGFADQAELAAPVFLEYNCPLTIFLITDMLDSKLWPWDDKVSYLINQTQKEAIDVSILTQSHHYPLYSQSQKSTAAHAIRNIIKTIPAKYIDKILTQLENTTGITCPAAPPDEYRPMSWDLAREYEQKGIQFAPHTATHRTLSKLDADTAKYELSHSWHRMNDELESPSPVFCYPTGRYSDYGPREVDVLKKLGFIGAVSTIPAQVELNIHAENYRYNLPRLNFPASFDQFVHDCSYLGYVRNRANNLYKCFS